MSPNSIGTSKPQVHLAFVEGVVLAALQLYTATSTTKVTTVDAMAA